MSYRFAIIGCGHIAHRHARQIARTGRLAAVCDIDDDKLQSFALQYHAKPYRDLNDLLAESGPDVVSICTPNGLHALQAIRCLEAGCHVLCEKPMTLSSSDGKRMLEAAKKAGKKLIVVKQNRFNPPVAWTKKILDEKRLGRIHSFQINCFWNRPDSYYRGNWHGTLALDGGTLFTQFSHFIDLLYWMLGDLESAKGWRGNFLHRESLEFEDCGWALLHMNSGARGTLNYSINSYEKNMEGSLTLFGEKGTIKIGGQYLNRLEYCEMENRTELESFEILPPNKYGNYEGSMSNHDKVYDQLMNALKNPVHRLVEAAEALKTVEMIEKIYAASPLLKAGENGNP